ncbi:hypothetical protein Dsin_023178 [Dipteronia sinensis]|uniref:ADP-ribosyl cyclase/cyclic ADP-ribose hydrolase n=1 Tax=Dipteronia sinensis TaxID=43782 RepID=A0AAE0E0I1_9ROSI|nr:hypothetical protein Dsin_023178 [Dipteronia sinensis]
MASSSTRLCRAVCFCVVSFASGFLVACLASLRPFKKSAVKKKKPPSTTITPPSTTITLKKKYNVFLSFRGPDTRVGFTSHLYDALSRKCMVTFTDYKLVRGDEISPALLKSIQESMIAVVIFSKDYASSKWCLRELAEIMKREKLRELIVLPVFYNVDPSDVRYQTGPFNDSFAEHENESPDEVLEWREAFTGASNLSGWDYAKTSSPPPPPPSPSLAQLLCSDCWVINQWRKGRMRFMLFERGTLSAYTRLYTSSKLKLDFLCYIYVNVYQFCILEFDGASKGNPGQAGARVVLRAEDGNVVWRIRQGVGIAAYNVAEYRALILGLKYALQKGFKHIRVHGDSMLVSVRFKYIRFANVFQRFW